MKLKVKSSFSFDFLCIIEAWRTHAFKNVAFHLEIKYNLGFSCNDCLSIKNYEMLCKIYAT